VEKVTRFDQPVTVRLVIDKDRALVESRPGDGAGTQGAATVLWSGAHGLAPDKPKYAGVRFIRGAGESPDVAAVKSIRVLGRGNGGAGTSPRVLAPEGRQDVAHGASRENEITRNTQPQRGVRTVASYAPLGLSALPLPVPTADAVGYSLSPLRGWTATRVLGPPAGAL
jgi:hypothetical protein